MNAKFLSLLLVLPMLTYCGSSKEDEPVDDETPVDPPVPTTTAELAINGVSELTFDFPGGTGSLSFTTNRDWTVTTMSDWIHFDPESGSASEAPISVTVTCDANTSNSSRDAYVVITASNLKKTARVFQGFDPFISAGEPLKSGSTVLATNPNVEKFLTEVDYPDHDWSFTKVLDYYGGFNGKKYNENGEEDPNGKMFNWSYQPSSDKPMTYSIRWTEEDLVADSDMTLVLSDKLGWSAETAISAGSLYVNITNLVPNDHYTYRVTADNGGNVLAEGDFNTTGHLHQVFFRSGCRNGRDLGGWMTLDGKMVKYRMLYRGGRMQSETVSNAGKKEILAEGIGGQLDLRNSDRLSKPALPELEFLAPGIETGGTDMLKGDHAKTKQCFEFIVNCLRNNKPVYFHCSLGRDRTGTLDILLLGLLGVREGDISKAYEVTYFAPVGYSVSSSESGSNPTPVFKNTRKAWVYSDVVPYFWKMAEGTEGGTFAEGVEKYLLTVAEVSQQDIDDFRAMMLVDPE